MIHLVLNVGAVLCGMYAAVLLYGLVSWLRQPAP